MRSQRGGSKGNVKTVRARAGLCPSARAPHRPMKCAMAANPPLPLLGRIAVHLKLITEEQLSVATRRQAESASQKRIGAILVESGFLTQAQLSLVLRARDQLAAKQKAMQAVASADPVPEVAAPAALLTPTPGRPAPAPAAQPAAPVPAAQRSATPAAVSVVGAAQPAKPRGVSQLQPTPPLAGDPRELHELLRLGVARGASDVHIHADTPLRVRLHGQFTLANESVIDAEIGRASCRERVLASV